VRLFEVIEEDRELYLIMEYAKGGDVHDHLQKQGRMSEPLARAKFRQVTATPPSVKSFKFY
jgi:serine/threonine protein kinase